MGRHSSGERRGHLSRAVPGSAAAAEDLRILLGTRRLLVLSIGAVLVIFAGYFLVLALLGRVGDWLLLLVVPAGLAGVSVGALLDRAHNARARAASGPAAAADPQDADPHPDPEPEP